MRILVEGTTLGNRRGFGRFTRGLLGGLLELDGDNEYTLLVDHPLEAPLPRPIEVVHADTRVPVSQAATADSRRSLRDMLAMRRLVARGRHDLVFFPAVYSYFPVPPGPATVVTFHDAIAELHPALVFPRRLQRLLWTLKVRLALRQADRLMAVSSDARRQIVEALAVDPGRIDVVTEGPDAIFVERGLERRSGGVTGRYGVPDGRPFVLYVGGISPHKNIRRLVGCLASPRVPNDLHLVLVGDREADGFLANAAEIEAVLASDPALGARVHFTGYVPDEELVEIYNRALAFVIPSYAEGFGLCPVEAMACGTPVLSSTGGSLRDVVGDAGLLFEPEDDEAIVEALARVATDAALREDLVARGRARAREFSWRRGAELALACFERTLAAARR